VEKLCSPFANGISTFVSASLESFSSFVKKKTEQIRKQHGCQAVEYSVDVQDGKVKLTTDSYPGKVYEGRVTSVKDFGSLFICSPVGLSALLRLRPLLAMLRTSEAASSDKSPLRLAGRRSTSLGPWSRVGLDALPLFGLDIISSFETGIDSSKSYLMPMTRLPSDDFSAFGNRRNWRDDPSANPTIP